MPALNKIIKLNAISRQTIDNQQCIVLDNQQDSLNHVHSLALIPAVEKTMPDGQKKISFPNDELQLLTYTRAGLFPIRFKMQSDVGYLVLGIVPEGVISDFPDGGHFPSTDTPATGWSTEDSEHDRRIAREWVVANANWVQTRGIFIYA